MPGQGDASVRRWQGPGFLGAEIESSIPYFHAEDIHGEVMRLTQELKDKMKEITRQRRRIERLEKAIAVTPVEVHSTSIAGAGVRHTRGALRLVRDHHG